MTADLEVRAAWERLHEHRYGLFDELADHGRYHADLALVASTCDGGERARAIEECITHIEAISERWMADYGTPVNVAAILRAQLAPAAVPTEGRDA